ncbi:branched-chain amino acid transport system substrate-binding protein [Rhodococcus sp. 27YEA15]|uniref:ABC transporter substrate-binding protein n=1 Tax=Rhodococcus sp. 27YEA15 TaxID=3156259 RepID=UPI003C7C6FB5
MRRVMYGILAILLVLTGCGVADSASSGDAGGRFRVLVITGTSGAFAEFANANVIGLKAAAKVINEAGGIGGREVEVKVVDDQSDATQAVSLLQQELVASRPDLVTFFTIDEGQALMPILDEEKILVMTVSGDPLADPEKYPYLTSLASDQRAPYVAMRKRLEAEGAKNVGFMTTNDGVGLVDWPAFQEAMDGSGMTLFNEPVNLKSLNVTPNMLSLKNKGIDHLVVESYTSLTSYIFSARTAAGMEEIPTIGDSPVAQTNPAKAIAPSDQKNVVLVAANPQVEGAVSGQGWDTMIEALTATGPISVIQSQATVYTGLQAFAAAATKAGSTDPVDMIKALRGKLESPDFTFPQVWEPVSSTSLLLKSPPDQFNFVEVASYNSIGQFPASAVVG